MLGSGEHKLEVTCRNGQEASAAVHGVTRLQELWLQTPSLPTPLPACTNFLQIPAWHIPPCPSNPWADVTFTGPILRPHSPNIPSHPSLLYLCITPAYILCVFLVHFVIAGLPPMERRLCDVTDSVASSMVISVAPGTAGLLSTLGRQEISVH